MLICRVVVKTKRCHLLVHDCREPSCKTMQRHKNKTLKLVIQKESSTEESQFKLLLRINVPLFLIYVVSHSYVF